MRRALTTSLISAVLILVPSVALAGGSWLEPVRLTGPGGMPTDSLPGWAAPGTTMVMGASFCGGAQAHPSRGPWTAFLRRDPQGRRIELAPVTIGEASGDGCPYHASVTFTVPAVESGVYWVDVCADVSCGTGVGDLIGGQFVVAVSSLEADLLVRIDPLEDRLTRITRRQRHLANQVGDLTDQLDEARDAWKAAEATTTAALSERDELARQLVAAGARSRAYRNISVVVGVALLVFVFGTLLIGRRRRVRISVPDTPEELEATALMP
jgi:hypothetical protein